MVKIETDHEKVLPSFRVLHESFNKTDKVGFNSFISWINLSSKTHLNGQKACGMIYMLFCFFLLLFSKNYKCFSPVLCYNTGDCPWLFEYKGDPLTAQKPASATSSGKAIQQEQ